MSALLVVAVLPLAVDGGLEGNDANAELIQAFTPAAFTTNAAGAIDIVGNALLVCDPNGNNGASCAGTLAGTNNLGNGSYQMIDYDSDDGVLPAALAGQTTNSSRAAFAPPADSAVLYASLHWSANSNAGARNQISFLPPGATTYQTVTGTVDAAGSLYQTTADITGIVQASGPGDYWAGNIRRFTGSGRFAAWSMVVVYENAGLPVRNLSVFDGFGRVTSSFRTLDVPISGFLTPPFGPINAEIGVVAYEGDRNIGGDQVKIDSNGGGTGSGLVNLADASNPITNFGNGSISDAGVGTGEFVNNLSVDIDQFATVDVLGTSLTDSTVRFETQGDWWYPGVLTTAIDLFVPEFPQVTKTVVDLNGGDALPGDVLEYTVRFENTGNDAAINSIVRDPIPDDTTFVPGSVVVNNGNGGLIGGEIVAPVGDGNGTTPSTGGRVIPGEVAEATFRVTIDESARGTDIENVASFEYTAETLGDSFVFQTNETVTPVPPLARLRIEKSGAPNPVASGDQVTWTVTVFNDGPNDATGVTVGDSMTSNTYASSSIPCSGGAGATNISCSIGSLAANSDTTFTITSDTADDLVVGTTIGNTASVSGNEEDDQPFNDSATAQVQARPESDLVIVKTDVQDPVPAGGTIDYDITVTNNGPSAASDVRISDQPDGQFNVTSVSIDGPTYTGTCDLGARSCALNEILEVGDSVTMSVSAQVLPFAGAQVTNSAEVQALNPDPNGGNTTTETTDITAVADLRITKATTDAPVVAGEQVTYLLTVNNDGPSTAQSVTVIENLPATLTLVSATPQQGSCSGTTTITCDLGSMGNGAQTQITLVADVPAIATGVTLANSASVSSPTEPAGNVGPENSASTSDVVANLADLRIVKSVDANPLIAGGTFEFTLEVTNDGPSATSGDYTIADAVDASLFTVTSVVGAGCGAPSSSVSCTDATVVPVGGSVTITISGDVDQTAIAGTTNTATVAYPTEPGGQPAIDNNSSDAEITLATDADVHIDKEWTTSPLVAGQNATFTLEVTNAGLSAAQNVSVTDALPGGATFVSATSTSTAPGAAVDCSGSAGSSVACTYDGNTVLALDQPLLSTDAFTVTVTVAIPADAAAGNLANTASVTSSTPDRNPDNNTDTDVEAVTRTADLTVTKVASDTAPNAGDTISYTVVVSNAGPSTGQSTFVGDPLPAGLTLLSSAPSAPTATQGTCSVGANALSCDLGEILPGGANAVTITYEATIDPAVAPAADLVNSVSANSPDDPTSNSVDETVTVGSEAELIVTKSDSVDPATPGGPLTYTVTVENNGPSDALDVVVGDPLPAGYAASSATSPDGTCDTTVSCTIGRIPAGGSTSITIVGEVDTGATGTLNNVTDVPTSATTTLIGTDTGSEATALTPAADLTITKAANPTTVDAGGGLVTYTIAVSNAGPSDAVDVDVDDSLPAGFVVNSVTPSQGTCASATTFPCDLGTVDAGGSATVIIEGSFPSTVAPGTVTNTAEVTSPTDPNAQPGSPKAADADVAVTRAADVSVAKSGPISVVAGETRVSDGGAPPQFTGGLQYEIAVQNAGPSVATGVTLADSLDAAFVLPATAVITVSPAAAGTCVRTGTDIDCAFGDVAVGDLITVTVIVDVRSDAPVGVDNLDNTAAATSTSTDPTPGNDSSTVEVDVTAAADITVEKVGPTQFRAGEAADYTITVTNDGPSDATNIVVTDTPPNETTFGAVSGTSGCTALPCTIPALANGASVTVVVSATVDADTSRTIVNNEATVSATDQPDPNGANNTDDVNAGVIRRADMELLSKTGTPDPVVAGGTLTYEVVARNNGPATARDAELTDTVPADTTLVLSSLPANCNTPGGATAPGTVITCDLGLLQPGASSTIQFDVVVDAGVASAPDAISNTTSTSSGTIDDVAGNESATELTDVANVADVNILKSASSPSVTAGEALSYTLTVENAGPSSARTVEIDDDISAIFASGSVTTMLTGAPVGTTCDATANCTIAEFPVGSFTIEISGTVAPGVTSGLSNVATITTDGGTNANDPDPSDNTVTENTTIATSADLRVVKVANPTLALPGDPIQYTITVFNDGPSDAQNSVIGDLLPADVTPATPTAIATATVGATCDQGALTCTFPTIAAGTNVEITVDGTVSVRAVDTIENTASVVSSATPDPDPTNSTTTISTPVAPEADLQISKATVPAPATVVAGETLRYQVTVFNNGPAVAENVEIVESLPANASFVNAATPVGSCTGVTAGDNGGTLTCDLNDLGDQTNIVIVINLLVDADATGTINNSVVGTSDTDDPDDSNNNAANPAGSTSDPILSQPDLRVRKVLTDPNLVAGDTFEYVITITNDGPSDALADVTLADTLPPEVDEAAIGADALTVAVAGTAGIVPAPVLGDCTLVGEQLDCTFGSDVPVGATITVTVTGVIESGVTSVADNTAVAATAGDPDPGNNLGTTQANLTTNADLVVSKSFDDTTVTAGNDTVFTISVTNNGPSDAVNTQLADTLPAGFTVSSLANASGGICSNTATTVTCVADPLMANATMTVEVTATVDPSAAAGPVTNTAGALSPTPDRNPSNNSDTAGIAVERLANLSVSKDASASTVLAGNQIQYTIVVSNTGPSTAEATVLGDPLPAGVVIETVGLDARCQAPGNVLTCDLGELDPSGPGSTATVTYTVTFDDDVMDGSMITNEAKADSTTPLVSPASDDSTVTVSAEADLVVTKIVTPDPVISGNDATYVISVTNNGPSLARNATFTDDTPPFLDPASATLPADCSVDVAGDVSCDLGDVAVNQTVTRTLVLPVRPSTPDGFLLTNTVTASSDEFDPSPATASASTTTDTQADITITKTADPSPAVPGEPIEYTIVVTNNGPSDALDVGVTDAAPPSLTGVSATSDDGSTCDAAVSCDLGTLTVGEVVTITIDATVAPGTIAAIDNTATVTSPTPPSPGGPVRIVTITTPVEPEADIGLTKTLAPNPPVPGQQVTYTLTVTNPGPSTARDVVVTDTLAAAITNVASATTGCVAAGQGITCTYAALDPGTQVITVTGDLDPAYTGSVSNSASVVTSTSEGSNSNPNDASVTAPVAANADVRIEKTAAPDPVEAGQQLVYTLTVTNDGPSVATGVIVDDSLPAGFDLSSISSSQGACTSVPCDLGTIAVNGVASVTIEGAVDADVIDLPANTGTVSSPVDNTPGNNSSQADPTVQTRAELRVTKVADPVDLVPGEPVQYTIAVINDGPSDALDVEVADTLPSELTATSITSSQNGCAGFPCDLGTIAPGSNATVTVTMDVPADLTLASITNAATASSPTPEIDTADNTGTTTNNVVPSADLTIVKTGPTVDAVPGETVTYSLTVTNDGPSDAQNVVIADTLDPAFDAATITTVDGTTSCTITGSDVSCTQATLASGASATVTITATVLAAVTAVDIGNTATATSATPDPNGPNESSITTPVAASADLTIVKADDITTTVNPDGSITYTITVTNAGPSDAQNVQVTDTLPDEIVGAAISSTQGGCTTFPCDLGVVTPATPAVITVTGTVSDRAVGSFNNSASVTSDTPDPAPGGETDDVTTQVTPYADLAVTKALISPATPTAGVNARYEIVVTNNGPAVAGNSVAVDTLPAGTTFIGAATPIGSCGAPVSGVLTCDLGDLADQASVAILVDVTIDADRAANIANSVTVSSDTFDPDLVGLNTAATDTAVTVEADLAVVKSITVPTQPPFVAGSPFQYTIDVSNNGRSSAVETIVVTDTLPAQVDAATVTVSAPCIFTPATRLVRCEFPADLASGASLPMITVDGQIISGVTAFDDNTADVATIDDPAVAQTDPDPLNNMSTAGSPLATSADLQMTKTFAGDPTPTVKAGESTTFDLVVFNGGPSDALTAEITDTLPAGMTITDITTQATTGAGVITCTANGADETLPCNVTVIEAGETVTLAVAVAVASTQPAGSVTNTATVTSPTGDPNPGNNTNSDNVAVTTEADITVVKAAVPTTTQNAGEDIDYSVTVTNGGPSTAEASVLGDQLPAGVTINVASILVNGVAPVVAPAFPNCAVPGGILICELGPLSPSSTSTITYTVTIDPDVADGTPIVNNAQVSSPTPPPAGGDERNSSETVDVTTEADLVFVSKTADPVIPVAGETTTYSLVVRNDGPSTSRDAQIVDDVPAGLTVNPASIASNGCTITAGSPAAGTELTCELGDVPAAPAAGSTITITYEVELNSSLADGSMLVNTATVSSPTTSEPVGGGGSGTGTETITVDTVADLGIAKSASPGSAVPGEELTYTITLTNSGPSWARNVTVVDDDIAAFPAGVTTQLAGVAAGAGSCDDSIVSCTFTDVPVGETTITITGIVDAGQTAAIPNTVDITATDTDQGAGGLPETATISTSVEPEADLLVEKRIDTDPVVPGQAVDFTITLTNPGPSVSQNVVLTDAFDLVLSNVTLGAGAPAECGAAGTTITCTFPTLAVGVYTIPVAGVLDEAFTGQLSNTASVTTDTFQGVDSSPNSSTVSAPATPVADIALDKEAAPDPVTAGEVVTYTITVDNLIGPSTATGVVVADALPAGLTGVVVSSSQGGCVSLPCTIGTLAVGQSETVTVTATVESSRVSLDANTATATVGAGVSDPNVDNNTDEAEPDVDTLALITTTKALVGAAIPGEPVEWTITVTNDGPSDAQAIEVADTLPPEVSNAVLTTAAPDSCTGATCDLGAIAVGVTKTITVAADLPADVPAGTLTNSATVTSNGPNPTPFATGSTPFATSSDPIDPRADLVTTKTLVGGRAVPGEPLRWIITVVNPGPSDALDVEVADTLPLAQLDPASIVVASTGSVGASCSATASFPSPCDLGTIPAGGTAIVTIDAAVPASVAIGTIENTATTTSSTPDADPNDNTSRASDPIRTEADLSIVKAGPSAPVVAGTAVSWTLTVTNNGPSDSLGVVIADEVPDAVDPATITVTSGDATCTVTDRSVGCQRAVLPVGEAIVINVAGTLFADFTGADVSNAAIVESLGTTDPDPTDNADSTTAVNAPIADIGVTGSVDPDPVPAGTPTTYTFDIVNDGPSDAQNTVITIPLPASLSPNGTPTLTGAPPGATVTIVDGSIIIDLGTLPPGTPVQVVFEVDVDPSQPDGPLPVTATGTTSTNQSDLDNDNAVVTLDVINDIELSITKVASAPVVRFGEEVTFTITVTNDGETPALGATITDDLPADLVATSATTSAGPCTVAAGGGSVECGPLDVLANSSVTVTIVAEAAGLGGMVSNTASVDCDCIDSPLASLPANVDVDRHADLAIGKSVVRAITKPGFGVTYTISVTNNGPDTAIDTVVIEQLPRQVNFTFATPSMGTYDENTNTWTIGDLAVGATATLQLRVVALVEGNFTNTATVSSGIEDRNQANNEASIPLLVISPDLPLTGSTRSWQIAPISMAIAAVGLALLLASRLRRRGGDTLQST